MSFLDFLRNINISYEQNADTSKITSIRAGGVAKHIVYPKSTNDLIITIKALQSFGLRYKIIGGCTNTFFSDKGYDGVIVSTRCIKGITIADDSVTASCGESLANLLRYCALKERNIASELFGIPGTVGGAIRNNAGAFGKEISDAFICGEFLDCESFNILTLPNDEMQFSYRSSVLQKEKLVFLFGKFKTESASVESITNKFNEVVNRRKSSQPNQPSLGSFFKRSENIIPSKMIESAGLKGISVGGAEISKKHAGFIVNQGYASASDIDALAILAEKTVLEKYGVCLIREAEYVI